MANNGEPLAEVQIDIPSQTAGQNILDVVASIWFEPGELHVDSAKITFGFVRAFLELNDTLECKYNDGQQVEVGKTNLRDLQQLEKKSRFGVLGNIDFTLRTVAKAGFTGDVSRSRTHTQASEQSIEIPLYTLQSIRSRRWVMFGIASASQLLHGRVVHTVEKPLVRLAATYKPAPDETERAISVRAEVKATRDDLHVIVTRDKSDGGDPNDFESQAVTKALLARALTRGNRAYDENGTALPLLLARGECQSRLGVSQ